MVFEGMQRKEKEKSLRIWWWEKEKNMGGGGGQFIDEDAIPGSNSGGGLNSRCEKGLLVWRRKGIEEIKAEKVLNDGCERDLALWIAQRNRKFVSDERACSPPTPEVSASTSVGGEFEEGVSPLMNR